MRNDGNAMKTRMMTGTTVHSTSSKVLWVVRDGVGFARALNLIMMTMSSASTNSVIAPIIHSSKIVKPDDVVHHRGRRLLQADLPGRGLSEAGKCRTIGRKQSRGERRNDDCSEEGRHCGLSSLDGGRDVGLPAPSTAARTPQ